MKGFITVTEQGLELRPNIRDEEHVIVTTILDFNKAISMYSSTEDWFCSSSVDFPEEYTSDPEVLALARHIRS